MPALRPGPDTASPQGSGDSRAGARKGLLEAAREHLLGSQSEDTQAWGQEETQKARLGVCTSLCGLPAACGNSHVASSSLPGLVNAGRCRSRGKLQDPGNAGQEGQRSGRLMPHLMLLPCPCDGSGERAEKAVEGRMHPYGGKMARSRPSGPLGYGGAVTGESALSHRHSNGGIGDG